VVGEDALPEMPSGECEVARIWGDYNGQWEGLMVEMTGAGQGGAIGAILGVVIGWFSNLIYMREKFVSTKSCENCKVSAAATETLQVLVLESKMGAVEVKVGAVESRVAQIENKIDGLSEQSRENHGLISEIHGWLKGSGKISVL
jgi:hypothetical protein